MGNSNRVIKFRAWDVHCKRMIEWEDLIENKGYVYDFLNNITENLVPLEYTGLKDRNGKEIYEGDILKSEIIMDSFFGLEVKRTGVVEWDDSGASFNAKDLKDEHRFWRLFNGYSDGKMMTDETEIIGNIYENSNLLN